MTTKHPPQAVTASGNIVVCNRLYNIGWPVVNYTDNPNFSAYWQRCLKGKEGAPPGALPFAPAKGLGRSPLRYRERRLMGGSRDLRRLQEIIRQFVVHHDGCATSADCFHVLHDERGLSVHFLIDNDGTIYQTLDLADGAFHATGVNEISVGVELCNRGVVDLDGPEFYRRKFGFNRDIEEVTVHNSHYRMWAYTPGQYKAMIYLGKALARLLPNLPQVYPEWNGAPLMTWMADPRQFAGYIGHYHVTNNKWDPGSFNFKWFTQQIRASATWFVCLERTSECPKAPEISDNPAFAEQQGQVLINANEADSMGGYFPVGPFGRTRLWHGGIHLSLPEGTPVFTPFPGRIVAVRQGDDVPIGSANFVLMRHYFRLAGIETIFYILYYHLDREDPKSGRTAWYGEADKKNVFSQLTDGGVAFPDIDVGGGEVIGHVGHAGPPGNFEGQIHVEVMSPEDIGAKLEPGYFKSIDAKSSGHFCDINEIVAAIDKPRGRGDGILNERELREFFQHDEARAEMRKLAVRCQSEWGADPEYESKLLNSKDFRILKPAAREKVYRDQILPTLWYTEEVAEKVFLPKDFIVWHYHPVRFIAWMNQKLRLQATTMAGTIVAAQGPAAAQVLDDRDSLEGFTDEEDEMSVSGRKLTLEDLAEGYPEEKEAGK
jgi:N-acetyl-anhydromuramyl-L-alanine amidase AmpD